MSNNHPTFSNPIINEALCEIHFSLPEGIEWEPSVYGKFFTLIQNEFPLIEPVLGASIRMRYRHKVRPLLFQLSDTLFTVNLLAKYPGWQQMRQDILSGWSWLREIIGPAEPTRIGLRYINFVPAMADTEKLEAWFRPNKYIANAVLQSRPSSSRIEVQINDQTKSAIQLAEITNIDNQDEHKFLLDIDAVTFVNTGNQITLADTITFLHDSVVWEIFDGFRTIKLDELLNQR
ncbi:hypothetical protein BH10CHL1_BH10CHL1_00410 [soil metagenome]